MNRAYRRTSRRRTTEKVAGTMTAMAVGAATFLVAAPSADAAKSITVIAHRGDRDDAPENTVKAFQKAIDKGAGVIEMDIGYSKSGFPVVLHDATLDRTTDCSGKLSRKTRTQLKNCETSDGANVPTLRGALSAISKRSSDVKVMLHMKVIPNSKLADRTMDDVKRYGMTNRTYILASESTTFKKMKAEGAKRFAYIFNTSSGWDKDYEIMIPYNVRLSSTQISRAHKRGNKVWAVENHPSSLRSMLNAGRVDGILADHLDDLLSLLTPGISARAASSAAENASEDEFHDTWADQVTRPRG